MLAVVGAGSAYHLMLVPAPARFINRGEWGGPRETGAGRQARRDEWRATASAIRASIGDGDPPGDGTTSDSIATSLAVQRALELERERIQRKTAQLQRDIAEEKETCAYHRTVITGVSGAPLSALVPKRSLPPLLLLVCSTAQGAEVRPAS